VWTVKSGFPREKAAKKMRNYLVSITAFGFGSCMTRKQGIIVEKRMISFEKYSGLM